MAMADHTAPTVLGEKVLILRQYGTDFRLNGLGRPTAGAYEKGGAEAPPFRAATPKDRREPVRAEA